RAFVYVSAQADLSNGAFGNSLYITYNDTSTTENNTSATANHSVVKVLRSRDGGATWASSTAHSTADVSTVDRFNPWMSVDANGRVFVMFYDTRNSVNRTGTDLYYSVSTDGAVTFSNPVRLTSVTSKNIVEANEWGDYNGMDMALNDIMAIYTDNRDETGGTAESKDVYVAGGFAPAAGGGNVAPTANFSFVASGLTVTFSDSSSDSDGTIASRSWNFGDSTTSTATNPSKTYASAGTRNVTLTVTDNGGLTSSITKAVTVAAGNVAPVANFSFTTSGLTATFTDSSTDSDGTIASRSWNFGDGGTSTATNPSRTYAAAGTFSVVLTVTDNAGATHAVTKSVTVSAGASTVLSNGVAKTGLAAAAGAELNFTMVVPSGASNLKFVMSGGTGDADLYVRFGSAPTDTVYDCRPFLNGNAETCNIATAQAGTYFVRVKAFSAFSGVSLTGSYSTTTVGPFFQNTTVFNILDNTTINSPITVSGVAGNAPSTLSVSVNITHTYQGDLKVDLVAPDGTLYNIHNRTGAGTDNVIKTVTINASSEVANGTWNMRVNDNAGGDTGRLNSWSMQF
ncbi:MAG: PKD domain-containing protein, partial [Lysobacterales bacterium]